MPLSKKEDRERKQFQPKSVENSNLFQPKLLSCPNGADYAPEELLPDGRGRYLGPFSDGQVLDRLTVAQFDKTSAMYIHLVKGSTLFMFTPNIEQLRENGVDLRVLMKPSQRGK